MKKLILLLGTLTLVLSMIMVTSLPALAAKPADNLAGAQKIAWNLSGAVMPVPPYGLHDIAVSDTASKLIVNQPNGKTLVTITGAMSGLHANTVYTVYLSNGYTPYVDTGWSVTGQWDANFVATIGAIGTYPHHMTLTQAGGALTGDGYYIPATQYTWVIDSGSVTGNHVVFHLHYTGGHPATWTTDVDAYIQNDGSLQGTWIDSDGNSGTMTSYSGLATKTHTGDSWWPGFFTSTVPAFTFTTDASGAGSWHINLTAADFPTGGPSYQLSVWINEAGGTVLISNTLSVTKR